MTNPYNYSVEELKKLAKQVRKDILTMVYEAQSGHPGGSLGCVEYMLALYFKILRYDPKKFTMEGHGEDVFVLSNGHISPLYYSVLARAGYFPVEELKTFRKINSRLQGHPAVKEKLPGIRTATGSLGQGLSVAIGIALGKKLNKDDKLVFCLIGDGEAQEGQIWEAAQFAPHHKVDNLIATMDWNFKQIDGDTRDVMNPFDMIGKWKSFGWDIIVVEDGNDFNEIIQALEFAKTQTGHGKPIMVLMKTVMGKGVSFMENKHEWHGKPPSEEQYLQALKELDI